ncbi:MAG: hypothetical protein CW338_06600 [Clostridiales bacterium]|nr:hypothetical protein [Clostridiales bacterium]
MGILVCGLNGAGKSTVGRLLADELDCRFIDNEDLWFPKDDPGYLYAAPRSRDEVIRRLEEIIAEDDRFVFAAVRGDYGDKLLASLTCAVLIEVPRKERMLRLRQRSFGRFGNRMLEGGNLYEREKAFLDMAAGRTEDHVERWLYSTGLPVFRMDGTMPPAMNVEEFMSEMKKHPERKIY